MSFPQIQNPNLFLLTQALIDPKEKEKEALILKWREEIQKNDPLIPFSIFATDHRQEPIVSQIKLSSFSLALLAWDWPLLKSEFSLLLNHSELGPNPDFLHEFPTIYQSKIELAKGSVPKGWEYIRYIYRSSSDNSKISFEQMNSLSIWNLVLRRYWDTDVIDDGEQNYHDAFSFILQKLLNQKIGSMGLSSAIEQYIFYQWQDSRLEQVFDNPFFEVMRSVFQNYPEHQTALFHALENVRSKINDYAWDSMNGQVFYEKVRLSMLPRSSNSKKNNHL